MSVEHLGDHLPTLLGLVEPEIVRVLVLRVHVDVHAGDGRDAGDVQNLDIRFDLVLRAYAVELDASCSQTDG